MKSRRTLSTIIILLIGIFIGFTIALLIGLVRVYAEGGKPLMSHRTFGDIKVLAYGPSDVEGGEGQSIYKTLMMAKDDTPFLSINQNEPGKIDVLVLLNDKKEAVLSMKPSSALGKWGQVMYGRSNEAGNLVGDIFVDIDFDGQFDVKHVMGSNGKHISVSIFINGSWQKVNRCNTNDMIAVIAQTKYTFDPNSGWQPEK